MSDFSDYPDHLPVPTSHPPRPPAPHSAAREPGPAPQVSASLLAYAARDAVRDVLPRDWQRLPDGTDTASVLAGVLSNHYAAQQQAQAERLAAAAAVETEADDG